MFPIKYMVVTMINMGFLRITVFTIEVLRAKVWLIFLDGSVKRNMLI